MSLDEETGERIVSAIESHSVTLFMKGSREAPRCGFSATLVGTLDSLATCFSSASTPTFRSTSRCAPRTASSVVGFPEPDVDHVAQASPPGAPALHGKARGL